MTEYIILEAVAHPEPDNGDRLWEISGRINARSAQAAISHHLGDDGRAGEYAAIPARSWRPVSVKVETKTALKFS